MVFADIRVFQAGTSIGSFFGFQAPPSSRFPPALFISFSNYINTDQSLHATLSQRRCFRLRRSRHKKRHPRHRATAPCAGADPPPRHLQKVDEKKARHSAPPQELETHHEPFCPLAMHVAASRKGRYTPLAHWDWP